MKNVLFINFTEIYGGAEVYLSNLLNYNQKEIKKYLLSPQNKLRNNLNEDIIVLNGYKKSGGMKNIFNYYYYFKEILLINKLIKEKNIDCLFFNGIEQSYMVPFLNKKVKKIAIWHINSINENILIKKLYKEMLKKINYLIIITKKQKESIEREFGDGFNNKLKLIYNGISEKEFEYFEPLDKAKITIAQISRLEKHKGIFDLIQAFKNIKTKNVELLIAGEGDKKKELAEKIKELKLENNVRLVGFVKTNEFIKNIDILVLPSYGEALPLVLLEGLSSGVPIIATNIDGIPEIIEDSYNGYLFEPGDIKKLELLLKKLINNFQERKLLSKRGNEIFKEKFTKDTMCKKTYSLIGETLK